MLNRLCYLEAETLPLKVVQIVCADFDDMDIDSRIHQLKEMSLVTERESPEGVIIGIHSMIQKTVLSVNEPNEAAYVTKCLKAFLNEIQREKQTMSIAHADFGKIYFRYLIGILSKQTESERFYQDIVENIGNLREALFPKARYQLFVNICREALKKLQALGVDHPDTLTTMANLAFAYDNKGEYAKSIELYDKVLQKEITILGEDHPNTLITMNNLATAYHSKG